MDLCKYKDILGVPGKKLHSVRIFGFALFDTVETIVGAAIIAYLFGVNFWITLLVLFVVGEILHWLFCVDTACIKLIKRLIGNR